MKDIKSIIKNAVREALYEAYSKGDKIQVIKTSPRGAKLITDGDKVAWVQGRWVRPDNTLTAAGEENLMNSNTTYSEWNRRNSMTQEELDNERIQKAEAARQERINAAKNEANKPSWEMPERDLIDASPKAYKIKTNDTQRLYGRLVPVYVFLPKSMTDIEDLGNGMIRVSVPNFVYSDKKYYIESMYGAVNPPKNAPRFQQAQAPVQPTLPQSRNRRYEIFPNSSDEGYEEIDIPTDAYRPAFCYVHGKLEDDFCKYQQIGDLFSMEASAEDEIELNGRVRPGVYKCSFQGKNCTLYVWRDGMMACGLCCYDDDTDAKEYIVKDSDGAIRPDMLSESFRYRRRRML